MRRPVSHMLACLALGLCAGLALGIAATYDINAGTAQPVQSTGTETVTMGDLKWLCLTTRTGAHIDARSCTLLDDMTGRPL